VCEWAFMPDARCAGPAAGQVLSFAVCASDLVVLTSVLCLQGIASRDVGEVCFLA
jgi:hypothetical protein